jgi:protein SCO1
MRSHIVFSVCLALAALGCGRARPDQRSYRLQGQVQSIDPQHQLVIVKHEAIQGLMPAMTMPYEVEEAQALAALAPGDLIDATLVVFSNGAHLSKVKKVGQAPLEKPAGAPSASSGFELLKPGEQVPDAAFVDQDGRKRSFAAFKGSPVVVTFIYTKCPLPTFCPLMDRHFATLQKTLKEDEALDKVRLVTVSFDPVIDTPPVLKAHAKTLGADLKRWTFLTGDRDVIDQFAARFGVSVARAMNDPRDITHNLRTAIVGADGALVKVYTGNEWTPDQVMADLKGAVPAS